MALDISAASGLLKSLYEEPIREWLNNFSPLMQKVRRNTENFEGEKAIIPVHRGRNVGTGARGENATLPVAGNQSHTKLEYNVKYVYATVRLSGPVMSATKSKAGSFARALQNEMKGAMVDAKKDVSRQLWHDGSSILTLCGVTGASTTVVVQSTKFLQVGQTIDVVVKADGTTGTGALARTVDAIPSATTFTISGNAITTDATFAVIKSGTRLPATWGAALELWGLEGIVSTANPGAANGVTDLLGGLTRTGNLDWQAGSISNSGTLRPLTVELMQQAWDECNIRSGEEPDLMVTNHAIMRRYGALLAPDRRYTGDGLKTFDGGWRGLEFNGIPFLVDPDASSTLYPQKLEAIYFLHLPSFELHQMEDWGWMDQDGAVLSRCKGTTAGSYVGQTDAYEGALRAYMQLGVDRSNTLCKLSDISESA